MRYILRLPILTLLLTLFLVGCGGAARSGPTVGDAAETIVVVTNQSTSDMRIYVVAGGQQVRLGSVTALQTQRLEIPSTIVGGGREISFRADPLAGQTVASSFDMYVSPGEEVRITIPSRVR
ncbi:MAG: hypothetical protein WD737_00440 [Gemmatimonadota bacterium]